MKTKPSKHVLNQESAAYVRCGFSKQDQLRCHVMCIGRQITHFHLERLPFHLRGIARAIML